jgi:transcriptional regulator with GAF, ATPase, and Fis domain
MPVLQVIKGYNIGTKYELNNITTIGRDISNTIQLLDPSVSRFHALIVHKNQNYTIHDKKSLNGIFVNGSRVKERTLNQNDEIQLGKTSLLFDSDIDIKNTLFGSKSVILSSPDSETTSVPLVDQELAHAAHTDKIPAALIFQVCDLASASPTTIGDELNHIMQSLIKLFDGDSGLIMLWDPVNKDLEPMVAICEEEELSINRNIIVNAFMQKKSVLSAKGKPPSPETEKKRPSKTSSERSIMVTPILKRTEAIGVIYLDKKQSDAYSLKDLALLQAISKIVATNIEFVRAQESLKYIEEKRAPAIIIGKSDKMREILALVEKVAQTSATVLIQGETGTGKELFAREIHQQSGRRTYPFIAINCASIPHELADGELFGYEKGAFTGATTMKRGKLELAHGGTIFLDEVGELAPQVQPKLLRFLQEKCFYRLGGNKSIRVDVRIIAASNKDLSQEVTESRFRYDLLSRLNVFKITLPPLCERREDIKLLADHFAKLYAAEFGKPVGGITPEALEMLEAYSWPGNIRELQNCLERAALLTDAHMIRPEDLSIGLERWPHELQAEPTKDSGNDTQFILPSNAIPLDELEKEYIKQTLDLCHWNQMKTAKLLGLHRNTLRRKIVEYGLSQNTS